jgi:hypothetical protein
MPTVEYSNNDSNRSALCNQGREESYPTTKGVRVMTGKELIINRLQHLAIKKGLDMEDCQDIADVYEKYFRTLEMEKLTPKESES